VQQVPPWVEPRRGNSIVLQFDGVDLSVGVVLTDSLEVLCKGCRVVYTLWLLEIPAKGLTVQSDCKGTSSVEEKTHLVPIDGGPRLAQTEGWGIGRDKVEGVCYAACPVVIHLISLELAMERVWMPSKLACCLSNLSLSDCNDIEKPVPLALC